MKKILVLMTCFVILNPEGKVIHTQDSGLLEEGKRSTGYNKEKSNKFLSELVNRCF